MLGWEQGLCHPPAHSYLAQDALENIAFTFEGGSSLNFAEGEALAAGGVLLFDARVVKARRCFGVVVVHLESTDSPTITASSPAFPLISCAGHSGFSLCVQQKGRVSPHPGVPGIRVPGREQVWAYGGVTVFCSCCCVKWIFVGTAHCKDRLMTHTFDTMY